MAGLAMLGRPGAARLRPARDEIAMRVLLVLLGLWLTATVALPLWTLLSKSFHDFNGNFVGLANYARYVSTPSLLASFWNSLAIAVVTTAIVIPLASSMPTRSRAPACAGAGCSRRWR